MSRVLPLMMYLGALGRGGEMSPLSVGLFRVKNEYTRKIRIEGDGIRFLMMCKALKRIGIQGDVEAEGEDVIQVLPDCFMLRLKGQETIKCGTIAEVLSHLQ